MPLLFSYGTLQETAVQLELFGRLLEGELDELVGFARSTKTIDDPAFVAKSGKAEHAVVIFTGKSENRVRGMVFELTDGEIDAADRYEPAGRADQDDASFRTRGVGLRRHALFLRRATAGI